MNEKLDITLPAEMVAVIRQQVDAGRYASPSEMLRAAVKVWIRDQEEKSERLDEIRAGVARSLADTRPPLSSEEVDARLDALAARYTPRR